MFCGYIPTSKTASYAQDLGKDKQSTHVVMEPTFHGYKTLKVVCLGYNKYYWI